MNRRPVRTSKARSADLGSILLAVAFICFCSWAGSAFAQSGAAGTDAVTPASETQHSNVEEPTEPADANPTLTPDREALAQKIFNELISPCCWTTTVAQHGSGAAPRIQAEVRRMIASGMGHQAILDRYVQEYGERILASPKKKGFNLAVYWIPPLGLAVGALFIALAYRRKGQGLRPAAVAAGPGNLGSAANTPAAPPPRAVPGSDEDYRHRVEEEIRRSS